MRATRGVGYHLCAKAFRFYWRWTWPFYLCWTFCSSPRSAVLGWGMAIRSGMWLHNSRAWLIGQKLQAITKPWHVLHCKTLSNNMSKGSTASCTNATPAPAPAPAPAHSQQPARPSPAHSHQPSPAQHSSTFLLLLSLSPPSPLSCLTPLGIPKP